MAADSNPSISPFALPSDTSLRFVLLVGGVVAADLLLDHVAYSVLHGPAYALAVAGCQTMPSPRECLAPEDRLTAGVMLAGIACLALVGAVVYLRVLPRWWVRDKNVKPYTRADPSLVATLAAYCEGLHISPSPRLFTRASRIPSAVAFWHGGSAALIVNLGLLLQFRLDPASFRAVVLHELAHVRNGDVRRVFVALAAVIALVIAGVVPYFASVALSALGPSTVDRDPLYIFGILWRVAVLTLVVLIALAGVLRARELFADARALAWDGSDSALRHLVAGLRPPAAHGQPGWLAVHPSPADRLAALNDPVCLLRLTPADVFAAGVIAAAIGPELAVLAGLALAGTGASDWYNVVAGGAAGALLAGIVGLAMARAALPAALHERPYRQPRAVALALAGGLILGQTVTLSGALDIAGLRLLHPAEVAYGLAYAVVLALSVWLLLGWLAAGLVRWLRITIGRRSARLPLGVYLATWAVLLGLWFGLLLTAHDVGSVILLAEISATGTVPPGVWAFAVALLIAFVGGGLTVALIARGCLRLVAAAFRPAAEHAGAWMYPEEPILSQNAR